MKKFWLSWLGLGILAEGYALKKDKTLLSHVLRGESNKIRRVILTVFCAWLWVHLVLEKL